MMEMVEMLKDNKNSLNQLKSWPDVYIFGCVKDLIRGFERFSLPNGLNK